MDRVTYVDDERVRIVEDRHPDLFGTVVRQSGRTLYIVRFDGERRANFVGDEYMRKIPPLQQLAEQALGNKTVNLSGKE